MTKLKLSKPVTEEDAKAFLERWRQSKAGAEIHRMWLALQEKLNDKPS